MKTDRTIANLNKYPNLTLRLRLKLTHALLSPRRLNEVAGYVETQLGPSITQALGEAGLGNKAASEDPYAKPSLDRGEHRPSLIHAPLIVINYCLVNPGLSGGMEGLLTVFPCFQ